MDKAGDNTIGTLDRQLERRKIKIEIRTITMTLVLLWKWIRQSL
jgi:hypothetical protein